MVAISGSHLSQRLLELTQCHRLDEAEAIFVQMVEQILHRHCNSGPTILGR